METLLHDFKIETAYIDELLDNCDEMFHTHSDEVDVSKEILTPCPDRGVYRKLEEMGALYCLKVLDWDEIIGYSIVIISPNIKYGNVICANNDALYIKKEYRHGRMGLKLIKATEDLCREKGATVMMWGAKPNTAFAKLLPKLGCKEEDVTFSKEL